MVLASTALDYTLGLIFVFGGIGVVVNGLIFYIVAQAIGERRRNQQFRAAHARPEE